MTKNDFYQLMVVIFMCLILFLVFDAASVLFASIIIYLKNGDFPFSWSDIVNSFLTTGYIGGVTLGICLWLKGLLQKRSGKNKR
ncbi:MULTISPECIES: hypothetical protein [Pantoea]|jgi:hypothetical protein|uniref:RsiW-degrading membrane proteinase PrsW (M82 family) n=1 Tax=[Curtobacterium] plantarum TaxID=221276 RepID=A0ABT9T7C2_9GAMM|nr:MULTISPECIES: hypothetical protein [Pantoea]AOE41764.1 hypothetical protein BEE12_18980 [Pantoea agglomerans]KNH31692.1 hypothetical protein ACS76_12045 [Pantoea vagans]MDQ0019364.1 RsiW-degrading membrane proteinase PrsW (M82 family) [[Curtobacterium] plantarum]NYB29088.1 hypothetical protein [Pantoea agglomerans]